MDEFYKSIFAWIKVKKKKIKRMNVTFCIFESTMYCNSTKSREWLSIVDFTSYLKLTFFIFQLIKAVSKNQTGLKHIRQLLFSVYSSAREKMKIKYLE